MEQINNDNTQTQGFTCQICSNTLKTTFVTVCGDSRHNMCAHCYNQSDARCPMCRVISPEFCKIVFEEPPTYIDANKIIMHQQITSTNSRFYTALIKDKHEDNPESTALNIYNLARYFTKTIQDASGSKTINPNFCGESIIDVNTYLSPGVKKSKELKTARRDISDKLFALFQLFVYKNLDKDKIGNILTVTGATRGTIPPTSEQFRGSFVLGHNYDIVVFYQLDARPTKQRIYGIVPEGMHRYINVYVCESSVYSPLPTLRRFTDEETGQFYERLETDQITGEGIGHKGKRLI